MSSFDPRYRRDNLPGNITIALYRIGQAIAILLRRKGLAHGLSPTQVQALTFLAYARPGVRTIGGLAQRLACTLATASGVASALEGKGLVVREPWPQHRRTITLRLTPQGQTLAGQVDDALDELEAIIGELPDDEQAVLLRATQAIVRRLAEGGHVVIYEMCWDCGFFRAYAHPDDPAGPHHCAFMDAPLPEENTYTECPDFVPVEEMTP
jgi:DNA-binding MarR family transcriptional regulator